MPVIVHWGCTNTVRESAQMAAGKEVCCHTEDSTLHQQHTRPGDQPSYLPTPFRNKNCNLLNHLTCALRNRKDTRHLSLRLKKKKRGCWFNCGIWCTSQPLYYFIWGKSHHTAPVNLDSKSEMYLHDSHVLCAWIYVKYCFCVRCIFFLCSILCWIVTCFTEIYVACFMWVTARMRNFMHKQSVKLDWVFAVWSDQWLQLPKPDSGVTSDECCQAHPYHVLLGPSAAKLHGRCCSNSPVLLQ